MLSGVTQGVLGSWSVLDAIAGVCSARRNECPGPGEWEGVLGGNKKKRTRWRNCSRAWWEGSPDTFRWSRRGFNSYVLIRHYSGAWSQEPGARSKPLPQYFVWNLAWSFRQLTHLGFIENCAWIFHLSPRMTYQVGGYHSIFFAVINNSLSWKASELIYYFPLGGKRCLMIGNKGSHITCL